MGIARINWTSICKGHDFLTTKLQNRIHKFLSKALLHSVQSGGHKQMATHFSEAHEAR